jgi:hypothetical protein
VGFIERGGNDFGHAEEGAIFNAFGSAQDDLAGVEMRADAGEGETEEFGGDYGDYDFGIGDGGAVAGNGYGCGDGKAGEEWGVFAGGEDLLGEFRAVSPEGELVASAAVKREGDGCSPCAGTED